jgi:hypothetical protein
MGVQQIREAFNRALGDAGSCINAYLDYSRLDDKQVQIITVVGAWADGSAFTAQTPLHDMSSDGQSEVCALARDMRAQARNKNAEKDPTAAVELGGLQAAVGPSASILETQAGSGPMVPEPSPAVERRQAQGVTKPGDVGPNPFMGL